MRMPLTIVALRAHVGSTFFDRGRSYFHAGRAVVLAGEGATIIGMVRGSRRRPYRVEIDVDDAGDIADSRCSCPMEVACKHVAALGLAARVEDSDGSAFPDPVPMPVSPTRASPSRPSRGLDALDAWTAAQGRRGAVRLHLLLQMQPMPSSATHRWCVALRPRVVRTASRRTSLTELQWKDAQSAGKGIYSEMPREHVALFLQLALTLEIGWASTVQWGTVMPDRASYAWHLLHHCAAIGVPILQGDGEQERPVAFDATPLVRRLVLRDANDGGIAIERELGLGDEIIADDAVAVVGQPPVFCAVAGTDATITLRAFADNATIGEDRLPDPFAQSFRVSPHQRADFLERHLPALAAQVALRNTSATVRVPERVAPRGVMMIAPAGDRAIRVGLALVYADVRVPLNEKGTTVHGAQGAVLLRDAAAERAVRSHAERVCADIPEAWDQEARRAWPFAPQLRDAFDCTGIAAARFVTTVAPRLADDPAWTIEHAPDLPQFTEETGDPTITVAVHERPDDLDWFDLNLTVTVGGEPVPFAELFTALANGAEQFLLASGRYFSLHHPSFDRLRALIREAGRLPDQEKTSLAISRFQHGMWEELVALGVVGKQAARWKKAMATLARATNVERIPQPPTLAATLRPYQLDGFAWLRFLRGQSLGGILGDDMGLGKTMQAIAFLLDALASRGRNRRPFLVVAPTSVVETWSAELSRFAPQLTAVILRRGDRSAQHASMRTAQVIVTSYPLLARDFALFAAMRFDTMILDEAQVVKNHQSKTYQLVRRVPADVRIAMTGTPMENTVGELWAIASIVAPGLFGTPERFRELYTVPIERRSDAEASARLQQRLKPFFLRRKKEAVATELPPKTIQLIPLDLDPAHRRIYDVHLHKERRRILGLVEEKGLAKNRFQVLQALMKLRRLALHAALVDPQHARVPSVKIATMVEHVTTLVQERRKVLIFSQFTTFLAHAKQALDAAGIASLSLDGSTKNRGALVERFQRDPASPSVFLISLKAGGFGLNLTAADACIILDPWWNPAAEQQAIDRTHRIGQDKNVFVYRFIAKGTIEEKVVALQEKKRRLFDQVVDGNAAFSTLVTEEEIRSLFA